MCKIDCKHTQLYACYLLDEAISHEADTNSTYKARIESNKQYKERLKLSDIYEGMRIDAKDTEGIWCAASIKTILNTEKNRLVLVHFDRWDEFFDELIPIDSTRLAPEGLFTNRDILRYKLLLPDGNKQAEIIK